MTYMEKFADKPPTKKQLKEWLKSDEAWGYSCFIAPILIQHLNVPHKTIVKVQFLRRCYDGCTPINETYYSPAKYYCLDEIGCASNAYTLPDIVNMLIVHRALGLIKAEGNG